MHPGRLAHTQNIPATETPLPVPMLEQPPTVLNRPDDGDKLEVLPTPLPTVPPATTPPTEKRDGQLRPLSGGDPAPVAAPAVFFTPSTPLPQTPVPPAAELIFRATPTTGPAVLPAPGPRSLLPTTSPSLSFGGPGS